MFVVHIGDDPDNAVWRSNSRLFGRRAGNEFEHGIGPIDVPVDRILPREHLPGESGADDHDRLMSICHRAR